jgi:hypothetical protein
MRLMNYDAVDLVLMRPPAAITWAWHAARARNVEEHLPQNGIA